ncbi:hypothetical protein P3H15_52125 [Rhodococcus sp. T2V]|uniref:hypothetical protein n=1 Tax=Rhodococcus sp. T2V TaxID=3034164 RepID=UPI0023E21D88|nr:hypothetical protein [Rhodococcus sp. T2V]MDF3313454.1 hypothetical protein [Rhodococcus sp. T2V]
MTEVTREQDRAETARVHEDRIRELETALATAEALRQAAEQLAAERALRVEDLRRTVQMLTAGKSESTGVPSPSVPASVPRRGPLERLVGRFGL